MMALQNVVPDPSLHCLLFVTKSGFHEKFNGMVMETGSILHYQMSLIVRKPAFCICENKDADQLRGDREADQHLCFRYKDSTIPLLPKSEISSLYPSSMAVQPGLSRTWSETPKTGFLTTRLRYS